MGRLIFGEKDLEGSRLGKRRLNVGFNRILLAACGEETVGRERGCREAGGTAAWTGLGPGQGQ